MNRQVYKSDLSILLILMQLVLQFLDVISKLVRDADRLDALRPTMVKNDIKNEYRHKYGKLYVQSARFKTRIQPTPTRVRDVFCCLWLWLHSFSVRPSV